MKTKAAREWWKNHERSFFAIMGALRQPSNGKRQADGIGIDPVPGVEKVLFIEHKASRTLTGLGTLVTKAITQLDACPPDQLPVIGLSWAPGQGQKVRRFLVVELLDTEGNTDEGPG